MEGGDDEISCLSKDVYTSVFCVTLWKLLNFSDPLSLFNGENHVYSASIKGHLQESPSSHDDDNMCYVQREKHLLDSVSLNS